MNQLLTYVVSPSTVYVSSINGASTATLTLTVTNNTGADVTFGSKDRITVTIPVSGNGALTSAAGGIIPTSGDPNTWVFQAQAVGGNQFIGYGVAATTVLKNGQALTLQLSGIVVSTQTGHAIITIDQMIGNSVSTNVTVSKEVPVLGITQFQASDAVVEPGGSSVLSWLTTAAETLTLQSPQWTKTHKADGLDFNGQYTVQPVNDLTPYTLTVTGKGANLSKQLLLAVNNLKIDSFSASTLLVGPGYPVTLQWQTEFATKWTIYQSPSGDPIPVRGPNGSLTVNPDVTTSYTLQIEGNGTTRQSAPLNVVVDMGITFTALPATVPQFGLCVLQWKIARGQTVKSVTLDVGNSPCQVASNGRKYMVLANDATFVLTVTAGIEPVIATARQTVHVDSSIKVTNTVNLSGADGIPGLQGEPGADGDSQPGSDGNRGGNGTDAGSGPIVTLHCSAQSLAITPNVLAIRANGGKGGDGGQGGKGGNSQDSVGGSGGYGGTGGNGGDASKVILYFDDQDALLVYYPGQAPGVSRFPAGDGPIQYVIIAPGGEPGGAGPGGMPGNGRQGPGRHGQPGSAGKPGHAGMVFIEVDGENYLVDGPWSKPTQLSSVT